MKIRNSLPIGEFLQLVYVYTQACRVRLIYTEDRVKTIRAQETHAGESSDNINSDRLQSASDEVADALARWERSMSMLCDTLRQFEGEIDLG